MSTSITETLEEDAPTNSMGTSSSTPGDGAIDIYDTMLLRKKKVLSRMADLRKMISSKIVKKQV